MYHAKKRKTPRPPKTTRWCVICKKFMEFKYNPTIGHSCCEKCGCSISRRYKPSKMDIVFSEYERYMDRCGR